MACPLVPSVMVSWTQVCRPPIEVPIGPLSPCLRGSLDMLIGGCVPSLGRGSGRWTFQDTKSPGFLVYCVRPDTPLGIFPSRLLFLPHPKSRFCSGPRGLAPNRHPRLGGWQASQSPFSKLFEFAPKPLFISPPPKGNYSHSLSVHRHRSLSLPCLRVKGLCMRFCGSTFYLPWM